MEEDQHIIHISGPGLGPSQAVWSQREVSIGHHTQCQPYYRVIHQPVAVSSSSPFLLGYRQQHHHGQAGAVQLRQERLPGHLVGHSLAQQPDSPPALAPQRYLHGAWYRTSDGVGECHASCSFELCLCLSLEKALDRFTVREPHENGKLGPWAMSQSSSIQGKKRIE